MRILLAEKADASKIAGLSYEVGRLHDMAMPDYFKPTTREEHLRIINEMFTDEEIYIFKAVSEDEFCGFLCLLVPSKPRNGFVNARQALL